MQIAPDGSSLGRSYAVSERFSLSKLIDSAVTNDIGSVMIFPKGHTFRFYKPKSELFKQRNGRRITESHTCGKAFKFRLCNPCFCSFICVAFLLIPLFQRIPDIRDIRSVVAKVSDHISGFRQNNKAIPQYPADRYSLDLAVIRSDGKKLDIEVDGEMYHRKWSGELCYRDQLRNQRLFELGWDVMRFWVFQIRDDMEWCIQQIKQWCAS